MRILFITANRIGDAVLAMGALGWMMDNYPEARFTIACGPVAADLFRAVPRLEKLIVLRKRKRHGHWVDLWRECIGTRWDLILDLRNSLVSRLLLAKRRGYRPPRNSGRHRVVDNGRALGLSQPPSPRLWLDAAAESAADRLLGNGIGPILALGPAANWPAKQWQIEKFIQVALKLTAQDGALAGARILVVAAPHEREQILPLIEALPPERLIDITGNDLLAVAACLKRCRMFIGNDSGLMHMAAAVGTPTLGLFGPSFEEIFGPWGEHASVVRTPESTKELHAMMPYSGAFYPNLMGSLSVGAVIEAANRLAGRSQIFPRPTPR